MFSQSLINALYNVIKESGIDGFLTVDSETLEVNNGYSGIKIFFSGSDTEEKNKARIELALNNHYRQ
mgnify:CR=1 FL=1